jgi:acyl-CoA reductase-like NAD-dependent aldehyde dehydrogenase
MRVALLSGSLASRLAQRIEEHMEHHGSFYIDGRWVESTSPDVFTLISPATEQPFATIALGQRADVDCAVVAARREEGARLVCGGPGRPEGLQHGYFIRPTIFAGVTQEMTIAREEIFGPVLAVLAYTDEAQAVHFANATNYGLGGYVFSADRDKAYEIGARMRADASSTTVLRAITLHPWAVTGNPATAGRWGCSASRSTWRSSR